MSAVTAFFFTAPAALFWCGLVASAVILASLHWNELTLNLADRVLALENLLLLWLIYPAVKTCHELGHASAVKRWGGEVHEVGIMLLVFVPVPYVDASNASAFREKRRRMIVGFSGIGVELVIASLAMILWVNLEPGALRALTFNVMLIAGVSTLLFNGNPLLRFDAYYILADYLEIPNLSAQANRYLGYLAQRYLLRNDKAVFTVTDRREAAWLVSYGTASFFYRIFISIRIALFVSGKFFFVGVLIAIWALAGLVVVPLVRLVRVILSDPELYKRRTRIAGLVAGLVAAVALVVFAIPLPSTTMAQGIVWPGEQSQIRSGTDGTVESVVVPPGAMVRAGDPLIRCVNPDLDEEVAALEAKLREYQARHLLALVTDRTQERIMREEIAVVENELRHARERLGALVIRSPVNGLFILPDATDYPGRYIRRGEPLGYVADYGKLTVLAAIPQVDVGKIRNSVRSVSARPVDRIFHRIPARLMREVPAASADLPTAAFSLEGGGPFALDPRAHREKKSFETLFYFEVALDERMEDRLGSRVYLRFEHEAETLAVQWYRILRRVFMRIFNL